MSHGPGMAIMKTCYRDPVVILPTPNIQVTLWVAVDSRPCSGEFDINSYRP